MNLIQKTIFHDTLETWHPEFLLAVERGGEFVGDITENIFKEYFKSNLIRAKFSKTENTIGFDCDLFIDNIIYQTQIKFRKTDTFNQELIVDYPQKSPYILLNNYLLNTIWFKLTSADYKKFTLTQLNIKVQQHDNIIHFDDSNSNTLTGNFEGIILIKNDRFEYQINDKIIWSVLILKNNKLKVVTSQVYSDTFFMTNTEKCEESIIHNLDTIEPDSRLKGKLLEEHNIKTLNSTFGAYTTAMEDTKQTHYDYIIRNNIDTSILLDDVYLSPLSHLSSTMNLRVQQKSGSYIKKSCPNKEFMNWINFYCGKVVSKVVDNANDLACTISGEIDYTQLFIVALLLYKFDKQPILGYKFESTEDCVLAQLGTPHDLVFLATTWYSKTDKVSELLCLSEIQDIKVDRNSIQEIWDTGFKAECSLSKNRLLIIEVTSKLDYKYHSIRIKIKRNINMN